MNSVNLNSTIVIILWCSLRLQLHKLKWHKNSLCIVCCHKPWNERRSHHRHWRPGNSKWLNDQRCLWYIRDIANCLWCAIIKQKIPHSSYFASVIVKLHVFTPWHCCHWPIKKKNAKKPTVYIFIILGGFRQGFNDSRCFQASKNNRV